MLKGFEVKQWIEGNYPQFVDKVFPAFTTVLDDLSIVYFTNTTSGGYVGQDTLELRVIYSDYDEAEVVKKNLIDIFQLREPNGGTNIGHPVVVSYLVMPIFSRLRNALVF